MEQCLIGDTPYDCICSKISDDVMFVETGAENPAMFTLDIKLPVMKMPKINDVVKFRYKNYKIASVDIDSAAASIKLHLSEMNKGIGK